MEKLCIVSPHLDDAALSCGVLMQRHAATADTVEVLNVFSAGSNAQNRQQEERNVQAALGATPHFLDEMDAPDRDPRFHSLKERFFYPLTDSDEALIARVAERIEAFLDAHGIDHACFPLGAGGHVDHRITFEAGRRIKSAEVRFYEDRPYVLWRGVLSGRLNRIGIRGAAPEVTAEAMAKSVEDMHYLADFMPKGAVRAENLPLYLADLSYKASEPVAATCAAEAPATPAEMKKLYESLTLYTSQMDRIYRSEESFARESFAYERYRSGNDAYVERYWTITPY